MHFARYASLKVLIASHANVQMVEEGLTLYSSSSEAAPVSHTPSRGSAARARSPLVAGCCGLLGTSSTAASSRGCSSCSCAPSLHARASNATSASTGLKQEVQGVQGFQISKTLMLEGWSLFTPQK